MHARRCPQPPSASACWRALMSGFSDLTPVRSVDTSEFIASLCDDLSAALIGLRPITLVVDAESHLMPQERAVPVGLIMNELLTNALKYAFPDERSGTVKVRFWRDQDSFCLRVHDDGVGMTFKRTPRGSGLGQRLEHRA